MSAHPQPGHESGGVFKTWQIFIFSLVPLALVFAGVIIGSIHGSDSEPEEFPPAPSQPLPSGSPTRAPGSSLWDADAPTFTLVYEDGTPFSPRI
jgi:hypothetical protein